MNHEHLLAPGARVVIRDAEWLVRRFDRTSTNGRAVTCIGLSELVRDKEAVFLTEIEKLRNPEPNSPEDTLPGGLREKTIAYTPPFGMCYRAKDYDIAWKIFGSRLPLLFKTQKIPDKFS